MHTGKHGVNQTDKQTRTNKNIHTYIQANKHTYIHTYRETDLCRQTDRQTYRQAYIQARIHTDIQTDKQTGNQTAKQTNIQIVCASGWCNQYGSITTTMQHGAGRRPFRGLTIMHYNLADSTKCGVAVYRFARLIQLNIQFCQADSTKYNTHTAPPTVIGLTQPHARLIQSPPSQAPGLIQPLRNDCR